MVLLWDLMGLNQQEMVIWLVVTGTWMDYFSIYWEFHDPNWLIFFRGVETTNQCWFQYLSENIENEERSLWMTFPSSFEIYTSIHYQNWKLLGGNTSSTPNSKCDIVIYIMFYMSLRLVLDSSYLQNMLYYGGLGHLDYWECHHPNWLSLHHFSEG